ncbi:MAG: type IV secretion system DNA-binding domain-containing protein [Deltaproteobacteria bacterium]|jgi:type IV secretory pathway TraG/TraD family ATPase VirD4|nr:type IV secretion system DNA-binding domain-containing protein [Deltaproteobacteria bacterium]
MPFTHEVIYGKLVENNVPPPDVPHALVRIPGKFNGTNKPFGITEEMLSKHLLLVGGTGSGKTNLFYHIVKQLKRKLTKDDVMLIFDSKGDFHKKFFAVGDIVIGNSVQYRESLHKWSIYEEIIADGGDSVAVAQNTQEICKSLFAERIEKNSNNPFFPNAARDLLASIITALVRDGRGSPFNNKDLKNYIDSTPVDILRSLLSGHKDLAAVASYIGGKSGSQAQGVLSEMYSVTRDVLTGVFADVGDFSIRKFIRNKGGLTAFLEYDLAIGDILSPIYTLLFDLALKEALGRTATMGNVYLIVDELKLLPNLRHLEDGINFGRSLGLKILAGLQSIDQLNANYDREAKARNAVTGFSSIFAFRSNDSNTREYVSKLFGRNLILETFAEAGGSRHYEKREGYMVEDWDLADLCVGEAIVGLPSVAPFKFKFDIFTQG